jgi:hypothetical protein
VSIILKVSNVPIALLILKVAIFVVPAYLSVSDKVAVTVTFPDLTIDICRFALSIVATEPESRTISARSVS